MKKNDQILALLGFFLLSILSVFGWLRFGHGLGDVFYLLLIYLGLILSILNLIFFNKKYKTLGHVFAFFLIVALCLLCFKMTVWRGPESLWDGNILKF